MRARLLKRLACASLLNLTMAHCGDASVTAGVDKTPTSAYASQALSNGLAVGTAYEITNKQTGLALDVTGGSVSNGALVWEWSYLGHTNQQWSLVAAPDGNVALVSINSNMVLDLPGGSTQTGVGFQQWSYWDQALNQRWSLQSTGDGAYFIKSVASGLCVDAPSGVMSNGTYPQQWGCWTGAENQKWYFTAVGSAPSANPAPAPAPTAAPAPTPTAAPAQGIAGLDFQAAGNDGYNIVDYGSWLQGNKGRLQAALDAAGASQSERALVTAMAMLETTDMDPSQRDASKDGTPSANLSILNLNLDMVQQLGYQGNDSGAQLNDPANLAQAVSLLLHGFRTWGVASTLNFQRGGRTAFNDGVSYGAADYRNVIASIYGAIAADASLLYDSRRVEIYLQHV